MEINKPKKDEYHKIKELPTYMATSSILFIYQFFILLTVTLRKPIFPLFLVFLSISAVINETIKKHINQDRPDSCGQKIDNECTGCGLYPEKGLISTTKGMPSGHSQVTAFTAMFWSLYFNDFSDFNEYKSYSIAVIWLLASLVWYQRYHSRCHSVQQIAAGIFIGSVLGAFSYRVVSKMIKN